METIRLKSHVNSEGSLELKLNNLPANQEIEILLMYQSEEILQQEINHPQKTTYEKFVESGLIGCVEIEEGLSSNYKEVLAQELAQKYDHC